MFLLIPLILFASGAAGLGYILWPKIKEIKKKEDLPEIEEDIWHLLVPEFFDIWNKIDFHGFKKNASTDYEKFLRRVRILSLKTDNFVNKLLENRQAKPVKPEFKEKNEDLAEESKASLSYFKTKESALIADIAMNPKDKNLYKALAILYFENQMYQDAKEVFDVVLELDPNDEESKKALEKIIH
ncbi:MAG: tetratricopeptide repeat protein [Patescibacteria group bacterium]